MKTKFHSLRRQGATFTRFAEKHDLTLDVIEIGNKYFSRFAGVFVINMTEGVVDVGVNVGYGNTPAAAAKNYCHGIRGRMLIIVHADKASEEIVVPDDLQFDWEPGTSFTED